MHTNTGKNTHINSLTTHAHQHTQNPSFDLDFFFDLERVLDLDRHLDLEQGLYLMGFLDSERVKIWNCSRLRVMPWFRVLLNLDWEQFLDVAL